jgi:hypothetical protein
MSHHNNVHVTRPPIDHLSELAQEGRAMGMSESGAQFVAMAVDPFADERQVVIGMPDQTAGKSNVFDIRQEITVTRPAALTVNDAWDAHVALMPAIAARHDGTSANSYSATWDPSIGTFTKLSNLTMQSIGSVLVVVTAPEGADTFGHRGGVGSGAKEYFTINIPELVDPTQRARLISIGYELINETEDLYKSGAVTDYRVDADCNEQLLLDFNAGTPASSLTLVGSLPPSNLAAAKQINGISRESKEGSLVIGCYDRFDHEAEYPGYGTVLLKQTEDPTSTGGSWVFGENPTDWTSGEASVYRELPFLQSGSYATNLSGQTKLRVVLHAVVEVFPAPGDVLMQLARNAPAYDPVAMEWLSQLQSKTLPGYPLSWNSSTKFTRALKKIFQTARRTVATLGPAASAVMMASGIPELRAAAPVVRGAAAFAKGKGKGRGRR